MIDNNAYMDKLVEYYKDCTNDRKEIVASPCFKLEYRNQSEEQILYNYLKNKSKSSQQNNHLNGSSLNLNSSIRGCSTPKQPLDNDHEDSYHNGTNYSNSTTQLNLSDNNNISQSYQQENQRILAESKPIQTSNRKEELLAKLKNKGKTQKDVSPRPVSPSSSSNNLTGAQMSSHHKDESMLMLDTSNVDLDRSRIDDPQEDNLARSSVSDMTLEGDYPDSKEKERLLRENQEPDLLNQTIRHVDQRNSEKMAQIHEQRILEEQKEEAKPLGESMKRNKIEELRRKHKEEAEKKRYEEARLEAQKRQEVEERERIRRMQEEMERKRLAEEERARELEREREEKERLEAQRREKEATERQRQRQKEEELRREAERRETEERERERQKALKQREEEEKLQLEQEKRRASQEEEERKKKQEARKIADDIKNQREVINAVKGIKDDLNETPKQSLWPTYGEKTIPQNLQNSFSFQYSYNESQQDMVQMSPRSQASEKQISVRSGEMRETSPGREERFDGTSSLLNERKTSTRRINRENSRQGSNVDSTETRDRFDGRSVGGQRTIPDRLKRIEELLEKVLENQINLEKRLDKIERVQDDQGSTLEELRANLVPE